MINLEYNAKDIVSLSAGKAFREKIGMYLSADRQEAINLGLRELIVNVQDEYEVFKPDNPTLTIELNSKTRVISVSDNMRGIPCGVRDDGVNSLTAAFLIPHSGGKHTDGSYSSSVGINGEGNKVVCHTAKWLKVEVHRDGKIYTQSFSSTDEGATADFDVKEEKDPIKPQVTGTKITYMPDEKVYGNIFISIDSLKSMLRELSYFTKGLKIILINDGKTEVFKSDNGLIDGLLNKSKISDPIQYYYETADCKVELALQWISKKAKLKGYANGLYMPDGGAFMTGFKTSLTKTFNTLSGEDFDGNSIQKFLDGFVSVKVKVGQFSNQAKTALANPEARTATSQAIADALKDFKIKREKEFEAVVAIIKKFEKAEAAADKARSAVLSMDKKENEFKRSKIAMPEKFKDCEKHGNDSMLIIVEGNSALSGLMPARDVTKEALYAVRGKVKNALKSNLSDLLKNQEVSDIILALGCGIQDKYNSKKLNYGKVAIATDADSDGFNIMCLIATMFYVLMPDFIKEKRLCWLRAPLYRLTKGSKRIFAYNEEELENLKKTHKDWEQGRNKGLGEMTPEDMEASMLHPTNRRLEILTIDDAEAAAKSIQMLMGKDTTERKDFLFANVDFSKINK